MLGRLKLLLASFFFSTCISQGSVLSVSPQPLNGTEEDTIQRSLISLFSPDQAQTRNPVSLGLVHMRKAGGSNLRELLRLFRLYSGCSVPTDGEIQVCPEHVAMTFIEIECIDGKAILESFPSREDRERSNNRLRLLTHFRDPIERIGSQFFFGKVNIFNIYFGAKLQQNCTYFSDKNMRKTYNIATEGVRCVDPSNMLSECKCYREVYADTMNYIRTSPNIWQKFFKRQGFKDQYLSNYYIKRLFSVSTKYLGLVKSKRKPKSAYKKTFTEAERRVGIGCLRTQNSCPMKAHDQLLSVMPIKTCVNKYTDGQIKQLLPLAKKLLEEHFEFLITEYYNTPGTIAAFESAIRYNHTDDFHKSVQGQLGMYYNNGTIQKLEGHKKKKYRSMMPPSIVKYLEEDNAEDIELYNFAANLFMKRYPRESSTRMSSII